MNFKDKNHKLWGGRFSEKTNVILEHLNASIQYDKRMWKEDIMGSEAYAKGLNKAGLLNLQETKEILAGLNQIHKEWKEKRFVIEDGDEDIHTANERRLKELIGKSAMKLHTGRSRNDQVITDMRLWLKAGLSELNEILQDNIREFVSRAELEVDILMASYTHLQRAQPVRWSQWLLSHCWSLRADGERLRELRRRVDELPLGSGAVAGNPFAIDRLFLADQLGFQRISCNSMHSVGDRDFVVEFLFWASLVGIHLSRLAEDLILFSSREFGFVTIADSFSTGSSLMPQKRNPDSLELIRGRAGRMFGQCSGFMMVMKGLPSTYNKDLQEDKEAMFNVFDSLKAVLEVTQGVVKTLKVNPSKCLAALSPDMLATDIAYYLVRKGVPFREAHHIAGEVVIKSEKDQVPLTSLPMQEFKSISKYFDEDIVEIWKYESSVEQYQATGGTSKSNITKQISDLQDWLKIISKTTSDNEQTHLT